MHELFGSGCVILYVPFMCVRQFTFIPDSERVLDEMLGSDVMMVVCVFIEDWRGSPRDWPVMVFAWPMVYFALKEFGWSVNRSTAMM